MGQSQGHLMKNHLLTKSPKKKKNDNPRALGNIK